MSPVLGRDLAMAGAKGLLELRRFPGELEKGLGGVKESGSVMKGARGGLKSIRESMKSWSRFWLALDS